MGPEKDLPYNPRYHSSSEDYIEAVLGLSTESEMLRTLCGGVHILDFMTREPDLYQTVLPEDWRLWLSPVDISDLLHLLLRQDIEKLLQKCSLDGGGYENGDKNEGAPPLQWRKYALPPTSFLEFIFSVRRILFDRSFAPTGEAGPSKLSRQISVGMSAKKEHEVANFALFVNGLTSSINRETGYRISHLVDFGSGQNYLGRVLAGAPYEKHIIALESKKGNIEGARLMDVHAKLRKKEVVFRNKKVWKATGRNVSWDEVGKMADGAEQLWLHGKGNIEPTNVSGSAVDDMVHRRIDYVEHIISDGKLDDVADRAAGLIKHNSLQKDGAIREPELMVISLHSCGNLLHHGLRSLTLNTSVKAVAMVGCCYNLCTERLGPPTYKLPTLRSNNRRLEQTSLTRDPHGFPMSERFVKYKHRYGTGVRFNITARMMAVQAPQNWTEQDCESFFTRHFHRALLQRIFLDHGFVNPPVTADDVVGGSVKGWKAGREPIVLGSLPKAAYKNFVAYVRAAFNKVYREPHRGEFLKECVGALLDTDIAAYEVRFRHKKHELCILWTLMAFTACVVECAIVADRWQFLKEQPEVTRAWVQTVFDYRKSPRNLAVIGIKR